jgi:hypothetical protein
VTTKVEDAAYMDLMERHISELEERLAALKNVMVAMNVEGADTHNQAELFANMVDAMSAVQRFRDEILSSNAAAGESDAD